VGRLLGDEGLARRLSLAGRRKVESWSWSQMLPEWDSLLRAAHSRSV
jgi:hypothetical protein